MRTLILNSTNLVSDGYNNTFKYTFPAGGVRFTKNQIALASIQLFYSFFNIDAQQYNNNSFAYTWIDGTSYTIVIPDGFYTLEQLNAFLKYMMVLNKHYLTITDTGEIVCFLELLTNAQYYNIQIRCLPISTTLYVSTEYQVPSGASWTIPVTAQTPQITILSTNNFNQLIGYNPVTFPSTRNNSTAKSIISDFAPQITPINSLMVSCSLINSPYGTPTNILHSFCPNATFGSMITSSNNYATLIDIMDGNYNDFTLKILDQNGRNIKIKDPSIVISLTIN